jgi:acyl-CoA reductase-like NAD-dependent aldehyde dehydrogenase
VSTHEARARRVQRAVALAARIADPADGLGVEARRELAVTSGLSREGVELALAQHLEVAIDATELASLLAAVDLAPRCHVILAANVCTAALRAVALALAASPSVTIRPSRRDPGLALILARELALTLTDTITAAPGDALHVYGSDATIAEVRASTAEGVHVRGHGTGLGIAVVGADVDLDDAARALAADVIPFDQRGCLSPRFALVEGGEDRVSTFAQSLHIALLELGERVPRGPLDEATLAAIALHSAAIDAVGERFTGPQHLVSLDLAPRALLLPPAARVLHVVPASAADAVRLLGPWARLVTTVGSAGRGALLDATLALAPEARPAALGRMQRPPLDGPVDRRGLEKTS